MQSRIRQILAEEAATNSGYGGVIVGGASKKPYQGKRYCSEQKPVTLKSGKVSRRCSQYTPGSRPAGAYPIPCPACEGYVPGPRGGMSGGCQRCGQSLEMHGGLVDVVHDNRVYRFTGTAAECAANPRQAVRVVARAKSALPKGHRVSSPWVDYVKTFIAPQYNGDYASALRGLKGTHASKTSHYFEFARNWYAQHPEARAKANYRHEHRGKKGARPTPRVNAMVY